MSRIKSKTTIAIVNAFPHEARYTSQKNAQRLIDRGLALSVASGILLLPVEQIRRLEVEHAQRQADDRLIEGRGGVLWWNGCDHRASAAHRPGENVFLPRPDRAAPYFAALRGDSP